MQTLFWASAALLAGGWLAQAQVTLPSGGTIAAAAKASKTTFTVRSAKGVPRRITVQRDETVAAAAKPYEVKLIGELPPSVLIVEDTYASKAGGMSMCKAGKERFLRVLSFAGKTARETFRTKLESCHKDVELASPGVEWDPKSSTLSIHWIQGPTERNKEEKQTVKLGADGKLL